MFGQRSVQFGFCKIKMLTETTQLWAGAYKVEECVPVGIVGILPHLILRYEELYDFTLLPHRRQRIQFCAA
jgi:hypothetical protein